MPAIEKHYKTFDYYAFSDIDIETWKLIVVELEQTQKYLTTNFAQSKLKDYIGFIFGSSEQKFLSDVDNNVKQLISMIEQFQEWITEKSKTHLFISVLGI